MKLEQRELFLALKGVVEPWKAHLDVGRDTEDFFELEERLERRRATVLFAAVVIRRATVSVYLYPLTLFPQLAAEVPPVLASRLKKSGFFSFRSVDASELDALRSLLKRAHALWETDKTAR